MPKSLIFLEDPYQREAVTRVADIRDNVVILEQTVFYPGIGVSSPDCGSLVLDDGTRLAIVGGAWLEDGRLGHIVQTQTSRLTVGDQVTVKIDWRHRLLRMRTHTALHIISGAFPFVVTGGSVGAGRGYIDFEVDRTAMSATSLQHQVHRLAAQDLPVTIGWRDPAELERDERVAEFRWPRVPSLIRVVRIGNFEVQSCDGLHVRNTSEVGHITINGIEPIGDNRVRVKMSLTEAGTFPFLAHAVSRA